MNGGPTHYGAVASWSVTEDVARLELTSDAQEALGLPPFLVLSLHALDVDPGEVRQALDDVLGAHG